MAARVVVLRNERSSDGSYRLEARIGADGSLLIEGQDLGSVPFRVWGSREYEWTITIPPEAIPAFVVAQGGDPDTDDPLDLLAARAGQDERYTTRSFLEEAGIPYRFWSRVGD